MNPLWGSLFKSTGAAGSADAVTDGQTVLSREALLARAAALSEELRATGAGSIALYADNGVDWVVVDLACQLARICLTPMPRSSNW